MNYILYKLGIKQIFNLLNKLLKEAGSNNVFNLSLINILNILLELGGIGIIISIFFSSDNLFINNYFDKFNNFNLIIILIIFILIRSFLLAKISLFKESIRINFANRLRGDFLYSILQTPLNKTGKISKSSLISSLVTNIARSSVALDQLIIFFLGLISFCFYALILISYKYSSLIPISISILATLTASFLKSEKSLELGKIQTNLNQSIQTIVGDGINGLKNVKAISGEEWLINKFTTQIKENRSLILRVIKKESFFNIYKDSLILIIFIIWLGIWGKDLSLASISAIILFTYKLASLTTRLAVAQRMCFLQLPGYEELLKLKKILSNDFESINSKSFTPSQKKIEIKDAIRIKWEIKYKNYMKTISIYRDNILVITGPSGSGKTTLLDLFCGLIEGKDNQLIFINNEGKEEIFNFEEMKYLKSQLSYLPQKTTLFETDLKENLIVGNYKYVREKDHENLNNEITFWLRKLKLSHLKKFINSTKKSHKLSSDNISGGELQRIGLIRSFLKNNQIEVYDEPTTYLDVKTSQLIKSEILKRSKSKFIIISTHDEEIIKMSSNVINLSEKDTFSLKKVYQN